MIYGLLVATIIFLYAQNNWIGVTEYNETREEFKDKGVFIHLSDIHGKFLGNNGEKIIDKIRSYDIINGIFITGDLIDSRFYNEINAIRLINGIKEIAPIFYVIGNHEGRRKESDVFLNKLEDMGVIVLRNRNYELKLENEYINILGIDDPSIRDSDVDKKTFIREKFYEIQKGIDSNYIKMLLIHRPEEFKLYVDMRLDFVFTGHAHGGQIRLPWLGGILAPSEGFFPKYSEGKHREGKTTMIVSRGIGKSIFPFRIFNRPEIVVVKIN